MNEGVGALPDLTVHVPYDDVRIRPGGPILLWTIGMDFDFPTVVSIVSVSNNI